MKNSNFPILVNKSLRSNKFLVNTVLRTRNLFEKQISFKSFFLRFILILLPTLLFNSAAYSQWITQTTGSSAAYYYDVKFFDANNGLVVNSLGEVYRTSDGGQTWTAKIVVSGLRNFCFVNNSTGFVYGTSAIFKTTDAGNSWSPFTTDLPLSSVNEIFFSSPLIGYTAGGNLTIYKTTNGGTNWVLQKSSGNNLSTVFFVNDNVGYVGGKFGYVYKTTDGGSNWVFQSTPEANNINCFFFLDANRGWAGGGDILITYNGGSTWSYVGITDMYMVNKVFFLDVNNGWAAGNNQLVSTTDGGLTWTKINTPSSTGRESLYVVNEKNIWSVGSDQLVVTNTKRIKVNYPNGGESVVAGSSINISFSPYNLTNVKIEYSVNNGASWNTITSSTPTSSGSYSWTTPNTLFTQCLVRISNADDATLFDQSDNIFTLRGVKIQVPNGGAIWNVESQQSITWTYAGINNVKLEYTTNNGTSWQTIVASTPASSQSYNWTVPNAPSNLCKIRISDASNASVSSESANSFTIRGLKLITPIGGEAWDISSNQTISWAYGDITDVKLEYSLNNGISWQLIIASTPASSGTYIWTTPANFSAQCLIRITNVADPSLFDQSDNMFILKGVKIQAPNGNEMWSVGSHQSITWTYAGITNVKLEYTTNNGTSWQTIVSSTPASPQSYSWTVPNSASNQCKIKISEASNINLVSQSTNVFIIRGLNLITPNGGDAWDISSNQTISWAYGGITDIILEYSLNNGASWQTIIASISASGGSYNWTIPDIISSQCIVRISNVADPSLFDQSDNMFTLKGVKIQVPNGGEIWDIGSQHSITWTSAGITNVKLEYTTNNGSGWQTIVASTSSNPQTYSWTIPNTASNQCKIRISDASNVSTINVSPNLFTIRTSIPNGIESIVFEDEIKIYPNPFSSEITVKYSLLQPSQININVIGINGHELKAWKFYDKNGSSSHKINLSFLKRGYYLINVESQSLGLKSQIKSFRIIKH